MHIPNTTQKIINQAEKQGFIPVRHVTNHFVLTTFEKRKAPSAAIIHVYIEGDGNSWKSKYVLSANPTPKQPLALVLAMEDPHPDVVYLARPCQYTPLPQDPYCHPKYWSSHRYAMEVITSASQVLDQIKGNQTDLQFVFIGFSGGASVATLLAAQRQDVIRLITVAGDLNHGALNLHHGTSPLSGSINAFTVAAQLTHLPQDHWSGSDDLIVPAWVAAEFVKEVDRPDCVKQHILEGAGHHRGWQKHWRDILARSLTSQDCHS